MKIVILEDEELARQRLKKLISEIDMDIEIVSVLTSVKESIIWYKENSEKVDLSLMDIHLSDGSSFDIFNHIDINHSIIFTTAYDQYAVEAFKINAVDYLLKPIKKDELSKALNKVEKKGKTAIPDELIQKLSPKSSDKRFLIKFGGQLKLVPISDVAYFFIEDGVTLIMTKNGKRYPIDETLGALIKELDKSKFFRLNRQFITNIDSISKMYTLSKAKIKVELEPESDEEIIVSTEKSSDFKDWLQGKST